MWLVLFTGLVRRPWPGYRRTHVARALRVGRQVGNLHPDGDLVRRGVRYLALHVRVQPACRHASTPSSRIWAATPTAWLQNTNRRRPGLRRWGPKTLPNPIQINNFSLIAVGVWMWTGFAMVILSAGLKGISIGGAGGRARRRSERMAALPARNHPDPLADDRRRRRRPSSSRR